MATDTKKDKLSLHVEGMTCSNCASTISGFLKSQGYDDATVNFSDGTIAFTQHSEADTEKIKQGIEKLGYKVHEQVPADPLRSIRRKFYFSVIWTVPLFAAKFLPISLLHDPYLQLALCIPVYLTGFIFFGKSAYTSLKTGRPNMDVLIFMGSTAAFVYSLAGTFPVPVPDLIFYETSAMIITLVLLGNYLEQGAVRQTSTALDELQKLQVQKALKIDSDGNPTEVDADMLVKDDVVQVNSGDNIPVDGIIVQGTASIDESMLTGESFPAEKQTGDKVVGGTILTKGNIQVKTEAVGSETVLSNIIAMVRLAQEDKPSIQNLADKVSSIFVPVVLAIALITFSVCFWWLETGMQSALMRAIAVLVISCPCALGLATPTAVIVGIGKAAKRGVLIRSGKVMETFGKLKTAVFDKTGTLTRGYFVVKAIHQYDRAGEEDIRKVIHSMERHSSHPLAKALLKETAQAGSIAFARVNETEGIGITAETDKGAIYKLGSVRMLNGQQPEAQHQIYLLKNDKLIAGIDLSDELRIDAPGVIDYFNAQNIKTVMLSGDSQANCMAIAQQTGIQKVYAEQLPDEKLKVIESYSKKGNTAMTGDGINDAPALARANVGVSLSEATEIAIQSAQIVLLNNKLENLPFAHKISKRTLTVIRQNLFWAFFYNIFAIPIAAAGFLNPMVAALSMAFSDVIIVGNSLRFKLQK